MKPFSIVIHLNVLEELDSGFGGVKLKSNDQLRPTYTISLLDDQLISNDGCLSDKHSRNEIV